MNIVCCTRCKKIFNGFGVGLCLECQDYVEECYDKVYRYVSTHPGASSSDASKATGVEEDLICSFIKTGRLVCQGLNVSCAQCGKEISGGTYCERCTALLRQGLTGNIVETKGTEKVSELKEAGKTGANVAFSKKRGRMHVNIRRDEE